MIYISTQYQKQSLRHYVVDKYTFYIFICLTVVTVQKLLN